jgi:putative aldouronate transport system permease protein
MKRVKKIDPALQPDHPRKLSVRIRQQKWLLLMLLPALVNILLFNYLPLSGWYLAFSNYKPSKGIFGGKFVGLKYFKQIFHEMPDLAYLFENTLVMNSVSLILTLVSAMVLAILLKEIRWKPVAKVVQSVTFFPYFISWVITYSIMWSLLSTKSGALNQILVKAGILDTGLNLLGDPKYSWMLIILLDAWKSVGYNAIIFLSAISGIPLDQYESAALDGANRFQSVWYITLPNILPTASVLLVMNAGWLFNSSLDQYLMFTNATNRPKMEVLEYYIYRSGIGKLNYSYATAITILQALLGITMMLIVNQIAKKLNQAAAI